MVEIVRHWALSNACFAPILQAHFICKLWLLGTRPQRMIASHRSGTMQRRPRDWRLRETLHETA
jgi:hypothetical protein